MAIKVLNEKDWVEGDYRPFATLNLEIEYFENKLETEAYEFDDEGLGPAKAIFCVFEEKQIYIIWHEYADHRYKTVLQLLYPFTRANMILSQFITELGFKNDSVTWTHEEI